MAADAKPTGIVQGTLQTLILTALAIGRLHGCGIGVRLEQVSRGALQAQTGPLFAALRRLERDGLADWGVTENSRRAKHGSLTASGRAQLGRETRDWNTGTTAIARILGASVGEL